MGLLSTINTNASNHKARHSMESMIGLIPKAGHRSAEDKMLISKIVQHIRDYVIAVKEHGKDFYKIPFDDNSPEHGIPKRAYVKLRRAYVLAYGRIAYKYIFTDEDNDIGFIPVCELLGFNAATFRNKLRNLTQKEAKVIYGLFLRGEAKVKHEREMKHERRI